MVLVKKGLVYAMGIDPGGTTGYAVIGVKRTSIFGDASSRIEHFNYGQLTGGFTDQVLRLCEIAQEYHKPFHTLAIALELFVPMKPITDPSYLSPVAVIERIRFCHDTRRITMPLFYQTPSQAMDTAPDYRLSLWGLYVAGPDHIKDGTKHAITFIRRAKDNKKLREAAWG